MKAPAHFAESPLPRILSTSQCRITIMSDTPPDRLSNDPRSKFHDETLLERGIGIRFNGEERTNVEEYCISEGWIRVAMGRALDRRGQPMTMKIKGTVEAWFRT